MVSMRRDVAVAVAWLVIGVLLILTGAFPLWSDVAVLPPSPASATLPLLALVGLAAVRSRVSLLALGLAVPLVVFDVLHGGTAGAVLIFTDLIYASVKYSSDEGLRWGVKVAAAIATAYLLALVFIPPRPAMYQVSMQWALIIAISAMWGWNVRSERARTRADLLLLHQEQKTELQHKIAHDLHDLVANHIAVAGLHIEAAKLLACAPASAPERLEETLAKAKTGTDHAHTELRNLISLLTEQPADPTAAIAQAASVENLVPAGRCLTWTPNRDAVESLLDELDPLQAGILSRVLTEAITNAVKHGSGTIAVDVADDCFTITNTVAESDGEVIGSGTGLKSAQSLLETIGSGLVTARDGGTWRTTITLRRSHVRGSDE